MVDPHDLRVALQVASKIPRATAARLAATLERWLDAVPDRARLRDLAGELGVPWSALSAAAELLPSAGAVRAREEIAARAFGARLVSLGGPGYSSQLADLDLPPAALWMAGELSPGPAIAIVGSRRASAYGLEVARWFARELAEAGVTVVSGFARGIDGAAHQGALESARGATVAFLGCGLGVDYPRGHAELGRAIVARGALLTEHPCGAPPRAAHFPVRNRLIAALASAVLVVEAAPKSGSLVTARLALDLGREVWAVPGRLFDETALGTNALLADGAGVATHPRDLLESLGFVPDESTEPSQPRAAPPLPADEQALLGALSARAPRAADALASACDLPLDRVLAGLLELELAGLARREPGGSYRAR